MFILKLYKYYTFSDRVELELVKIDSKTKYIEVKDRARRDYFDDIWTVAQDVDGGSHFVYAPEKVTDSMLDAIVEKGDEELEA